MTIDHNALTAQQRLAVSRRALVREMNGGAPQELPLRASAYESATTGSGAGFLEHFAWAKVGRKVVERWWRRHPANAATQLARPFLDRYAKEQPGKLVAIAATSGALIVLAKPWRLLSVTAVVTALLKSSDIADMVTTLMQKNSSTPRKDEQ
ncbi:hypothetical protein [Variovorax sp. dw_308]|uniref:hypothetical protein n=1 Tax=Variovorax sp. dw_308 TaxID=2721546 RepID=UPI001C482644|nr:hypothetical protein [Variovorax sp. dw_308]